MDNPGVAFEWENLHDEQELPPILSTDETPGIPSPGLDPWPLMAGALFLLAAAFAVSSWIALQARMQLALVHDALAMTVEAEARERGYVAAPASGPGLAVEVQALEKDMAAVMVVTAAHAGSIDAGGGPATTYRQLRFYRRTEEGWQSTEPIPALWGQLQHLATEHFDFTYRSGDSHAVESVAWETDAYYEEIRRNLGLPSKPERRIKIAVAVEPVPRAGNQWREHITVSSPALLRASDALSDAAILQQAILPHLVDITLNEAASTHLIPPRWSRLLRAMRQWQIWDAGSLRDLRGEPVLRWLIRNLPVVGDGAATPPVAHYSGMCTLQRVAPGLAGHTEVRLVCHEQEQASLYMTFASSSRFPDIARLPSNQLPLTFFSVHDELINAQDQFEFLLTIALLDYAAATYGRAPLGEIWPLLNSHEDWETLVPAVFGVSAAEFEAGWRMYLAEAIGE